MMKSIATIAGLLAFFLCLPLAQADRLLSSVVRIERSVTDDEGQTRIVPAGSGVVLEMLPTEMGCHLLVATARHVITDFKKENNLGVYTPRSGMVVLGYYVISLAAHARADIGYVRVIIPKKCADVYQTAAEISYGTPDILEEVIHIGYPAGMLMVGKGTVIGKVSLTDPKEENIPVVSTTLRVGFGSSGGAVFYRGKLVGLITALEDASPFRSLYTEIIHLRGMLPDCLAR